MRRLRDTVGPAMVLVSSILACRQSVIDLHAQTYIVPLGDIVLLAPYVYMTAIKIIAGGFLHLPAKELQLWRALESDVDFILVAALGQVPSTRGGCLSRSCSCPKFWDDVACCLLCPLAEGKKMGPYFRIPEGDHYSTYRKILPLRDSGASK
ncbi:hypothetical protein J3F83DRAFT_275404 [Trichoderma novae-zelandiae]